MRVFPGLWLLCGAASVACGSSSGECTTATTLSGRVVDSKLSVALTKGIVVFQTGLGGLSPDPSKPNTTYAYTMGVDPNGLYSLRVTCSRYLVHAYADGYHTASQLNTVNPPVPLALEANTATDVTPTLSNAKLTPANASPGETITMSVDVTAPTNDPLSDQVFLLDLLHNFANPLTPPSAGSAAGYPNGTWTRKIVAPTRPGPVIYDLVVATQGGLTAHQELTLVVEP